MRISDWSSDVCSSDLSSRRRATTRSWSISTASAPPSPISWHKPGFARPLPRTAGRARMAAMSASVSPALDFPGRDKLVAVVDAAVSHGDEHAITAALRNGMCAMIRNGEVRLPDEVFEPLDDHYARRELYRSPEHGYSVVATP